MDHIKLLELSQSIDISLNNTEQFHHTVPDFLDMVYLASSLDCM